jgi:hypothetical protein
MPYRRELVCNLVCKPINPLEEGLHEASKLKRCARHHSAIKRKAVLTINLGCVGLLSGPTMFRLPAYDPVALAIMGLGILLAAAMALSL